MSRLHHGVIRTPEGVYVLKNDSHLSRWVEQHQRLDVAEAEIMERFAKYIPKGGTVVDAGACIGDHTITYSKLVGPKGMVYAFEPNPLAYRALTLNFPQPSNVSCYPVGLADRIENATLHRDKNVGASFLTPLGINIQSAIGCVPLDDVLITIPRLDFIHLDCEGYELKVLKGARILIARFKPVIVLEINRKCLDRLGVKPSDILEFLINSGYRVEELEAGIDPHSCEQRDILALPNP